MDNFREFVMPQVAGGVRRTYVARIEATQDRYYGTVMLVDPKTGVRTNCELLHEPASTRSIHADSFFRCRQYYRRALAGDLKQAVEEGRVHPSQDGAPHVLSIGADLTGLPQGGHPLMREDTFWDWIDVFDENQLPAVVYQRPLPRNLHSLVPGAQCKVLLIASPGGYLCRLYCALQKTDEIFGDYMPLVVENPWRESVPADIFYGNREKYRNELITRIDLSLDNGSFTTIRASPYETDDSSWPFDWIVRADLDPRKWPQGYPPVVMDDLTNSPIPVPVRR